MAIAQKDLVVRNVPDASAPWIDTGAGVELKVMRVDAGAGIWVIRNRFAPGVQLQTHKHTGPVDAYTLQGRWHYLEYDFYAQAGDYLHEPAGSVHTLQVPEDNTEPTDVLFVIEGALLMLTPDGQVESAFDGEMMLDVYIQLAEAAGVPRPSVLAS